MPSTFTLEISIDTDNSFGIITTMKTNRIAIDLLGLEIILREECQKVWEEATANMPEIKEEITFEEYVEECRVDAGAILGI